MLFDAGCVVCGITRGPVCGDCRGALQSATPATVPRVARCRVAFELDDHSRPIIAAFKYRRQRRLARWLASEMVDLVPRCADVITWVPATPERRQSRGFDQAQELAKSLGHLTGVPVASLLRRDPNDTRQTGRTRSERLVGPSLRATRSAPSFVVLVDDVITTGSSMRAAADALLAVQSAVPQRIVGLAVASTPISRDGCLHDLSIASSIREWT